MSIVYCERCERSYDTRGTLYFTHILLLKIQNWRSFVKKILSYIKNNSLNFFWIACSFLKSCSCEDKFNKNKIHLYKLKSPMFRSMNEPYCNKTCMNLSIRSYSINTKLLYSFIRDSIEIGSTCFQASSSVGFQVLCSSSEVFQPWDTCRDELLILIKLQKPGSTG